MEKLNREELSMVFNQMNIQERKMLSRAWGVPLATARSYCNRHAASNNVLPEARWLKCLNFESADSWRARLNDAKLLREKALQSNQKTISRREKEIEINIKIPEGILFKIFVNNEELLINTEERN